MGIYKIEQKRLPLREQWILNYVNFLACILRASNWLKNNQLLSKLTHAHYRDTVFLSGNISSGSGSTFGSDGGSDGGGGGSKPRLRDRQALVLSYLFPNRFDTFLLPSYVLFVSNSVLFPSFYVTILLQHQVDDKLCWLVYAFWPNCFILSRCL